MKKLSAGQKAMEEKFLDVLVYTSTFTDMKRRAQEKIHELRAEKEGILTIKNKKPIYEVKPAFKWLLFTSTGSAQRSDLPDGSQARTNPDSYRG